jgi:hypothetical protein
MAWNGLALLRAAVEPVNTADMNLHDVALEIGLAINHSTDDTLYVAFAIAMVATGVVVSDAPFIRAMRTHPDPDLAAMLIPLDACARSHHVD